MPGSLKTLRLAKSTYAKTTIRFSMRFCRIAKIVNVGSAKIGPKMNMVELYVHIPMVIP